MARNNFIQAGQVRLLVWELPRTKASLISLPVPPGHMSCPWKSHQKPLVGAQTTISVFFIYFLLGSIKHVKNKYNTVTIHIFAIYCLSIKAKHRSEYVFYEMILWRTAFVCKISLRMQSKMFISSILYSSPSLKPTLPEPLTKCRV